MPSGRNLAGEIAQEFAKRQVRLYLLITFLQLGHILLYDSIGDLYSPCFEDSEMELSGSFVFIKRKQG